MKPGNKTIDDFLKAFSKITRHIKGLIQYFFIKYSPDGTILVRTNSMLLANMVFCNKTYLVYIFSLFNYRYLLINKAMIYNIRNYWRAKIVTFGSHANFFVKKIFLSQLCILASEQ